ncbi:MAG: hypothetical protein JNL64_00195 [Blastocatellia bacterium]|nr:hypothetical protein [Blastocatellia bacterium]
MQDRNRTPVLQMTIDRLIRPGSVNSVGIYLDGLFGQIYEAAADQLVKWVILTDGRHPWAS